MQSNNTAKQEGQPSGTPVFQRPSGSGGGNKKGTSAERRATHNAIERARRESLNGRFLQLAASLPAISDVRRPSKSLIVNKSLDFVADAMNREAVYRLKIDNMRQENMQLRQQLNKFLTQAGLEPLPQPPVEELPVPMAELGNKKRQTGMNFSGPLGDMYDLEDDDGLFAAGSEGEGGKTSPTSSCSATSSMPGPLSTSLPAGVAAFMPISHNGTFTQPSTFLAAPAHPAATTGVSPGASSSSEGVGSRERSAGFEDAAGKWSHANAFDGQMAASSTPASAQQLTYASLAFSAPVANNGLLTQGTSGRPVVGGHQHFTTAGSLNLHNLTFDSTTNGASGVAAVPAALSHNGMLSMNAGSFINLRNAQQLQQQQQVQLQLQQQQQHQQHQHQVTGFAPFNPSSFFEHAPLQSASFMTAV